MNNIISNRINNGKLGDRMYKTPFFKWIFSGLILFSFVFVTNFVQAFDIGDLFGGGKKSKFLSASIDLTQLRMGLDEFKKYDQQTRELDEQYSKFTQEVLGEQKKNTDNLMNNYKSEVRGLNEKERAVKLEQYKEEASILARDAQQRLDSKKNEIDSKKMEIEQSARIVARRMVRDVAKKKGYAIVVEKKMSIYIKNDITQEVITAVKKQNRKKFLGVL